MSYFEFNNLAMLELPLRVYSPALSGHRLSDQVFETMIDAVKFLLLDSPAASSGSGRISFGDPIPGTPSRASSIYFIPVANFSMPVYLGCAISASDLLDVASIDSSPRDVLSRLWRSSLGLNNRFRERPLTHEASSRLVAEEAYEFIEAMLSPSFELQPSAQRSQEGADVLVVIMSALINANVPFQSFVDGIEAVIEKNDKKTEKTHILDTRTGKIRRRSEDEL